jgi:molybdate transport system substrate-binding protein
MNTKIAATALITIIICVSAASYIIYNSATTGNSSAPPVTLRVFMASSLINVVTNMTNEFNAANHCNITLNSAGSNTLYQQINSGLPCDVFMSADFKWTKQLNVSGLIYDNNCQNFTKNSLEVLLPRDKPQNITTLLDLIKPGIKIVIGDPSIPAGSYTNTTLAKIDTTWGNENSPLYLGPQWQNYRSKFLANVVSYETAVENVVGKVSLGLGTADAGIAFVSDATYRVLSGAQLNYIQIPSSINTVGTYSIAVIKGANHPDLAQKFVDFWSSTRGQMLLQTYGFGDIGA